MFRNVFSFDGRIRRTEYAISLVMYLVFLIGSITFARPLGNIGAVLLFLLYIPLMWFVMSQGAKRSHDLGNSGWMQIIPFYGVWILFAPGQVGINRYGSNPKGMPVMRVVK